MKLLLGFFATVVGGWIVLNLIGALLVGWIAKAILPGKENLGWGKTLLLGFLGGIVGKIVFAILRWPTGFPMGFVASVLGAFALLVAYQTFAGNKSSAKPA